MLFPKGSQRSVIMVGSVEGREGSGTLPMAESNRWQSKLPWYVMAGFLNVLEIMDGICMLSGVPADKEMSSNIESANV